MPRATKAAPTPRKATPANRGHGEKGIARYDETKHPRGQGGRFASKGGATSKATKTPRTPTPPKKAGTAKQRKGLADQIRSARAAAKTPAARKALLTQVRGLRQKRADWKRGQGKTRVEKLPKPSGATKPPRKVGTAKQRKGLADQIRKARAGAKTPEARKALLTQVRSLRAQRKEWARGQGKKQVERLSKPPKPPKEPKPRVAKEKAGAHAGSTDRAGAAVKRLREVQERSLSMSGSDITKEIDTLGALTVKDLHHVQEHFLGARLGQTKTEILRQIRKKIEDTRGNRERSEHIRQYGEPGSKKAEAPKPPKAPKEPKESKAEVAKEKVPKKEPKLKPPKEPRPPKVPKKAASAHAGNTGRASDAVQRLRHAQDKILEHGPAGIAGEVESLKSLNATELRHVEKHFVGANLGKTKGEMIGAIRKKLNDTYGNRERSQTIREMEYRTTPTSAAPATNFGPSKATLAKRPDYSDAEHKAQVDKAREILGPKATDHDIASITGAPDNARVFLNDPIFSHQNSISMFVQAPGMTALRTIRREPGGDLVIRNDNIKVEDTGKGLGAKVFGRQVEQAARLGATRIETRAARGPEMNGYITWPKLGYDAPIPATVAAKLPDDLRGAKQLSDLMKTEKGTDFWTKHGVTTDMTFDLAAGSHGRTHLAKYLEKKGLGK